MPPSSLLHQCHGSAEIQAGRFTEQLLIRQLSVEQVCSLMIHSFAMQLLVLSLTAGGVACFCEACWAEKGPQREC